MAVLVLAAAGSAMGATMGWGMLGMTGAQVGWMAGSILGSVLFPPTTPDTQGPRLSDLKVQSSAYGSMIPVVYGTFRVAGNVIWSTELIETTHETDTGGKGGDGGGTQTSYTYAVSCAVGVCAGEILRIRKIWASGTLIYEVVDADGVGGAFTPQAGTVGTYGTLVLDASGAWSYVGLGNFSDLVGPEGFITDVFPVVGPNAAAITVTITSTELLTIMEATLNGTEIADQHVMTGPRVVSISGTIGNPAESGSLDGITFYTGSETQAVSALMESHLGTGNVPAYRGLAYVQFEDFQLEKYGNRAPNFSFEVEALVPATVGLIVSDVCSRVGLSAGDVDVTQLTDPVAGYALAQQMSGRSAIEPLQTAYYFDVVESS